MKKVIIVGGGFAGISALKKLSKSKANLEITLIDKKETSDFLPSLPDIVSQKIDPSFLNFNLIDFTQNIGCKFINQEVISLNLFQKSLNLVSQTLNYDYLLLASGTQANFFGNQLFEKQALKLDNINNTKKILDILETQEFDKFIIVGGGYTGIEIATSLRYYYLRHKKDKDIIIIEKSPNLLGALPKWIQDYVQKNLNKLNIKVLVSTEISQIEKKALVVWVAGVKASDYIFKLNNDKTAQGRLKVDQYLRLDDNCFVAGDTAYFIFNNQPLRMSIQFAIKQGALAAENILNSIQKKSLLKYNPKDLGYIIPMANNKSCGLVFGLRIKGLLASFFHYFMCVFRSWTFKNKLGIIKNLIKGGV